jgi:hypothetical protein
LISLEIEKRISKSDSKELFKNEDSEIKKAVNEPEKNESDDEIGDLFDIKLDKSNDEKPMNIRKDKNLAQSLSILFWSFAKKEVQDASLFSKLTEIFFANISEYNLHSIALNMYAMSVVGLKLQPSDINRLEERLKNINLENEKSLTLKTIIVLLEKVN